MFALWSKLQKLIMTALRPSSCRFLHPKICVVICCNIWPAWYQLGFSLNSGHVIFAEVSEFYGIVGCWDAMAISDFVLAKTRQVAWIKCSVVKYAYVYIYIYMHILIYIHIYIYIYMYDIWYMVKTLNIYIYIHVWYMIYD